MVVPPMVMDDEWYMEWIGPAGCVPFNCWWLQLAPIETSRNGWCLRVVELSSKLVSCGPGPDEDDDDNGFVQITMAEGWSGEDGEGWHMVMDDSWGMMKDDLWWLEFGSAWRPISQAWIDLRTTVACPVPPCLITKIANKNINQNPTIILPLFSDAVSLHPLISKPSRSKKKKKFGSRFLKLVMLPG